MNIKTGLFILGASVLTGCTSHWVPHADLPQRTDNMSWLSGCWVNEDGTTREIWSESFDGLIFGYSVTLKDHKVTFFEELRIEKRETKTVYIASPRGTGTTEFALTLSDEQSALFENPSHDFPQRLHYQRDDNKLTIDVSSMDQSKGFQLNLRQCE